MSDWEFFVQELRVSFKIAMVVIPVTILIGILFWVFWKDKQ